MKTKIDSKQKGQVSNPETIAAISNKTILLFILSSVNVRFRRKSIENLRKENQEVPSLKEKLANCKVENENLKKQLKNNYEMFKPPK